MTDIKVFENNAFGLLRVINNDTDTPKFVAKDVCNALGITNASSALNALDSDEKGIEKVDTLGGKQNVLYVTESGLYAIIMRSNKPSAREFRKWVTSTVLPSIRKTGAYVPATNISEIISNPDFAIELLTQLKQEREQRQAAEAERDMAMRINSLKTDMFEPSAMRRFIHGVVAGLTQTDDETCHRSDNYYKIGFRSGKKNKDNPRFKDEFNAFWSDYHRFKKENGF
jgi:prophage antirepressor-like protein